MDFLVENNVFSAQLKTHIYNSYLPTALGAYMRAATGVTISCALYLRVSPGYAGKLVKMCEPPSHLHLNKDFFFNGVTKTVLTYSFFSPFPEV